MKEMTIFKSIGSAFSKAIFAINKKSPEILIGLGLTAGAACVVLTAVASTKVVGVIDEAKSDILKIKDCLGDEGDPEYTEDVASKEIMRVKLRTTGKLVKLYGAAAATGLISVGSILVSRNVMSKRNAALGAAFVTATEGFKEYRNRVEERFGKDVEYELKHGIREEKVETVTVDETTGKEKKTKSTVKVADNPNEPSTYARFFDELCDGWQKNSEYNLMFLRAQQSYANDKLQRDGYLFLNDVYEQLGIPKTKAGQVVGWVYNKEHPIGDNFVDFGIYDVNRRTTRDFVNGLERSILLDFNVDGNIWELM